MMDILRALKTDDSEEAIIEENNYRLCNCQECGKVLMNFEDSVRFVAECMLRLRAMPKTVHAAQRFRGRPICNACFQPNFRTTF